MLLAYIDESHTQRCDEEPNRHGYDVYYVGCLLATAAQAAVIDNGLDNLLEQVHHKFGVPRDAEFHGQCMFQYKDDWKCMKGMHRQSAGIYRAAMRILADSGARLVIRGVHVGQLQERYREHAHNPHQVSLQHCLERVNMIAEQERDDVSIMADKVADQAAQEGQIARYQLIGNTEGYFPSDLARIKMPFQWEDSRILYGLQMIDIALFMCGRASGIDSAKKLNDGDKAVLKIVDVIRPAIMPQSAVWYPLEKRTDYGFITELS